MITFKGKRARRMNKADRLEEKRIDDFKKWMVKLREPLKLLIQNDQIKESLDFLDWVEKKVLVDGAWRKDPYHFPILPH